MEKPSIIYEDNAIAVLNKPAGMVVYPDGKHDYPAVSHWLEKNYAAHHFAHRIDRETSGVLVVAKTQEALAFLKKQFADREVKKVYRAFVYGPLKEERGMIERPIGSARGGRGPRSATRPHGATREASTTWKRLKNGTECAYIEAYPKTGRTHQIRVHLAAIQHPIVCDQLYAPQRPTTLGFERLALHALSVTLELPEGGGRTFTAELPEDFIAAEQAL